MVFNINLFKLLTYYILLGIIVIRILYFCCINKIVLLNAFEKPDNYKSNKEKRRIIKYYDVSQKYLNKFKLNNYYEKYK